MWYVLSLHNRKPHKLRTTDEFFGKRPNWILDHPEMRGNAYNQSVYTHLRGLSPYTKWRSERELARAVSTETGFTEAACRKALATLKKCAFYSINDDGKLSFGDREVVMGVAILAMGVAKVDTGVATTGYRGSQSGYVGSQDSQQAQGIQPYRDIDVLVETLEGKGTNVPLPSPEGGARLILGADPEEENEMNKVIVNKPLQVFDYFNFVARKYGAVPVTDTKDRVAFLSQVKRSIQRGMNVRDIMRMIDAFFQFDRHREHRSPWKVFFTNEVQRTLMAVGGGVESNDPILDWISNDFQRTEELPWDESFDAIFQRLVHHSGMSVAYRYPDVLASIAKISSGDDVLAESLLTCAASLIDQYLNGEEDKVLRGRICDAGVLLPKDLKPNKVRREAMTLREAVLTTARLN